MFNRNRGIIIGGLACIALSGCTTPQHTNLLIFGTNTQFGIKVGADATQTPSVQVGYNRQELVLMPLLANTGVAADGKPLPCPNIASAQTPLPAQLPVNCKYIGLQSNDQDAYSVLASFGAKFDASKGGTPNAGGAIAQYFATGLAARELAKHGSSLVAASEGATAEAESSFAAAFASEVIANADKGREDFAAAVGKLTDATFKQKLQHADDVASAGGKLVRSCAAANTAADCAAALRLDNRLRNITGDRWTTAINGLNS